MTLLQEWLGATIDTEQKAALEWKRQQLRGELPANTRHHRFEDESGNLRVKCVKEGVLQIIKIINPEEPISVEVTDPSIRIRSVIAKDAHQKFKKERKGELTTKVGRCIRTKAFDVVATIDGPRSDRITLLIKDFEFIDAVGSASSMPRPIETVDTQEFGNQESLRQIRKEEKRQKPNSAHPTPAGASSPAKSDSVASSYSQTMDTSQIPFATQIPLNAHSITKRGLGADQEDEIVKGHVENGLTNGIVLVSDELRAAMERVNEGRSRAGGWRQENKEPNAVHETHQKPSADQDGLDRPPSPPAIDHTNSDLHDRTPRKSQIRKELHVDGHAMRKAEQRIPSRDIRISKDQEELLNQSSSWLPAEPGHRNPHANIPIAILEQLNGEADALYGIQKMQEADKRIQNRHDAEDEVCEVESSDESDSDVPIGLTQWPASPDYNRLPPDSSPIAAQPSPQSAVQGQADAVSSRSDPQMRSRRTSQESTLLRNGHSVLMDMECASPQDTDIETAFPEALKETPDPRINKPGRNPGFSDRQKPFVQVRNTPQAAVQRYQPSYARKDRAMHERETSAGVQKEVSSSPCEFLPTAEIPLSIPTAEERPPATLPLSEEINPNPVETNEAGSRPAPSEPLHPTNMSPRAVEDTTPTSKHKRQRNSFFYPPQNKRLRAYPTPPALDTSCLPANMSDPAVSARQHRREWFAARRDSESSTSRGSPMSAPVESTAFSPLGRVEKVAKLADSKDVDTTTSERPAVSIPSPKTLAPVNRHTDTSSRTDPRPSPDEHNQIDAKPQEEPYEPSHPPAKSQANSESPEGAKPGKATASLERNPSPAAAVRQASPGTGLRGGAPDFQREIQSPSVSSPALQRQISNQSMSTNRESVQRAQHTSKDPLSTAAVVFTRFKETYPDYHGSLTHFTALCKKIRTLSNMNRSIHRSLWDDFVIRHKQDYSVYMAQCEETAEDPLPYDRFYNEMIEEPKNSKRILTNKSLEDVLSGESGGTSNERVKAMSRSSAADSMTRNPSVDALKPPAIVDLTGNQGMDKGENAPPRSKNQRKRSSLPWTRDSNEGAKRSPEAPRKMLMPKKSGAVHPAPHVRDTISSWRKDEYSPYRKFARDHSAIRPGGGNSFAHQGSANRAENVRGKKGRDLGPLKVYDWHL